MQLPTAADFFTRTRSIINSTLVGISLDVVDEENDDFNSNSISNRFQDTFTSIDQMP